jgi:tRNA(adenine34) deaminase
MNFNNIYQQHLYWMDKALELARQAGKAKEIPVGALIIDENNNLLTVANNYKERDNDATAHAEILAIRQGCQLKKNWHLTNCNLYVTLEPCPMCTGAIIQARLKTLIYGIDDFRTGCIRTVINIPDSYASNHSLEVVAGIRENDCRQLLQSWFEAKRSKKIR